MWKEWAASLAGHPDKEFADYVVSGIREGFRIGFNYSHSCKNAARNMPYAAQQVQVVREYLANECATGRVLGPLEQREHPHIHTSPIGVIPKGSSGKWRLIVDLSSPEGESVNEGIGKDLCSLQYVSVDDAVRRITGIGRQAMLAKVDIKSAYRVVPIHPEDRWLLGMVWEGALYVDSTLPFGLRSAPKLFTALADAVEWILKQEGVEGVMHYLDDFLIIGPPHSPVCQQHLSILLRTFQRLGLPVAEEKLEGPTMSLPFLGIEIDSDAMIVRLPPPKLRELQSLIRAWKRKKACRVKELQSLVGKLQHAAKVVKPGRTFLRRMFELLARGSRDHHFLRLNQEFKSDLAWWDTFLEGWNGIGMFDQLVCRSPTWHVFTDASGRVGCGALWLDQWIQYKWQDNYAGQAISQKELLAVVLACAVWGKEWEDQVILIHCDNEAAVQVVNSGYSKDPQMMHLLRCLFFLKAQFHLEARAEHIPGEENTMADALSRDNMSLFFSQVPQAKRNPTKIPETIIALLVDQQPDWTTETWCQLFKSSFQRE